MDPRHVYRQHRKLLAIAGVAAAALVIAGCSSSSSKSSASSAAGTSASGGALCSNLPAGPIKIANIVPLSGPTAQSGQGTQIESEVAVAYFNAHDSVCGHSFALSNDNDKGDPATSLSIARQLVSQGTTIVLADSFSDAQNQVQPYLMQQHVLVVNGDGAIALFDPKTNPTAFSFGPSNVQYAQAMVSYAKAHNENNIGILNDGTSFSVELAGDVQTAVKAAGLTFVKEITYSPTALDLSTTLTQAKQSGIETLMPTGFTGVNSMVAGLKQIGWSPAIIDYGIFSGLGVTADQVPASTVSMCSVHYTADATATQPLLTATNTALLEASKAKVGVNPETYGILGQYSYLLIVKYAVEHANSLDGQKMAAALESATSIPTLLPGITLSYSATNHYGLPDDALTSCTLKTGPYDILYQTG